MYYTKSHPFEFEEIHEGGDKVYQYLTESDPDFSDFGLGMITHSVKFGADKFNFDENLSLLGYEGDMVEDLRRKLTKVLNIDYETSKTRAHNILEIAVEVNILKDNPGFIDLFIKSLSDAHNIKKAKDSFTKYFGKDGGVVSGVLDELLAKAKPEYFEDSLGLAHFWEELVLHIDPPPDYEGLARLLNDLDKGFDGRIKYFWRMQLRGREGTWRE